MNEGTGDWCLHVSSVHPSPHFVLKLEEGKKKLIKNNGGSGEVNVTEAHGGEGVGWGGG